MSPTRELYRRLPAMERLMADPDLGPALAAHGRAAVLDAARRRLAALREEIQAGRLDGERLSGELAALPQRVAAETERAAQAPYRRVLNATGVLVHTNLGRAPLARQAAAAAARAAAEPLALEYDLEAGRRGSRGRPVTEELQKLFPGRGGLVVGNNAAAVMLALNTCARDREVLISRGELVEIGGSFRVPDIMERAGARLREVGTTNRTRVADYAAAMGAGTGAILRVHPSNFRQVGFTEQAATRELAELAGKAGVPLIADQGSGNLHELAPYGIRDEPTVASVLEAGADLVTFSGDKLLGGPQAGLAVGDPDLVARLAGNPMARALRPDKIILAALVETLRLHRLGRAFEDIPVLHRLATPAGKIRVRAGDLARRLAGGGVPEERLRLIDGVSRTGGGTSPGGSIATVLLALEPLAGRLDDLADRLRRGAPAVVARVSEGRLLLDLRTVEPEEDELLAEALLESLRAL